MRDRGECGGMRENSVQVVNGVVVHWGNAGLVLGDVEYIICLPASNVSREGSSGPAGLGTVIKAIQLVGQHVERYEVFLKGELES